MATCLAFLRVADIAQTKTWYESIGFVCVGTHAEPGCGLDWALMDLEGAQFMLFPNTQETIPTRVMRASIFKWIPLMACLKN